MKFRVFCTVFFVAAWLVQTLPALAAEVPGLYVASATVSSRDDERERQRGFNAGLREVLVKLTGRRDTLDNPVVMRALSSPQSYVETWAYNSILPDDPFAQPGQTAQIQLQVTFFQAGIQQLLNDAAIAIWPRNRPETLVWIAVQDELGERFRATEQPEEGGDIVAALRAEADKRGVPLLLPLLDFTDLSSLNTEQLWNFDINTLRIASSRYGSESILALRVFRSLSGDVIAKAVYVFRDQVLEFDVLEDTLQSFVEGSIDLVAVNLSRYYAILLSGTNDGSEDQVLLTVDGVGSAADYAGLMQYLNSLAVVSGVQVLSAKGATLELQLSTGGQARQLVESVALDRRLTALGEVMRNGPEVRMHYRWSQP